MFEVNGREMHLYCIGEGSPTVILEAGVGGDTLLWAYIQPAVAETTRVCAYDRADYGWSEVSSSERTTPNMAKEVHILLTQAGIGVVRLLVPTGSLPLPFFAVPADFPNREALIASLATNTHSDTALAEWDAFAQSAEVVNEIDNVADLPVQLITALNTYHEQPLPGENAEETTQT